MSFDRRLIIKMATAYLFRCCGRSKLVIFDCISMSYLDYFHQTMVQVQIEVLSDER